jgi:uncharacterized membrane protein YidH (DUF202 family)
LAALEITPLRCKHVERKRRFERRTGTEHRTTARAAAVAGMVGPILFATVLLALTAVQYDFMLGIGWQPLSDPAGAWPSGLALGPHGWAMTAGFVASGLLLMLFAVGLHFGVTGGRGSRAGPALLFVAGAALSLMGFETDPIRRTGPRTLHGWVHDLAFILFALALLAAFLFLWRRLDKDRLWRDHARYTLATGLLATLLLFLPGVAYYLFLVVVLAWLEATAVRLRGEISAHPRGTYRSTRQQS